MHGRVCSRSVSLREVPALIYPLDRSEAMVAVVDSNLHREKLLPSEKAFSVHGRVCSRSVSLRQAVFSAVFQKDG